MAYLPNEDRLTEALNIIEWEHHMVHKGQAYTASIYSSQVANNGYLDVRITGVKKDCHVKVSYTSEGKAFFKTYSGTTYSNDGTTVTPFNRCLCSTNVAKTLIRKAPTVNVLGTLRLEEFVGSGGAAVARAGGTGGGQLETIINPGYDLLLRLQNVSGNASDLQITLNFYELEPDE